MSSIICFAQPARNRLVFTGGVALNALGNMRLLEHFDEAWFENAQQRKARLHLWVPPDARATPVSPSARPGDSPISPVRRAAHP